MAVDSSEVLQGTGGITNFTSSTGGSAYLDAGSTGGNTFEYRTLVPACNPSPNVPDTTNACAGMASESESAPLNLLFLVDRSLAMAEPLAGGSLSRWQGVQQGIDNFLRANPVTSASIRFFGLSDNANPVLDCAPGSYASSGGALNPPMVTTFQVVPTMNLTGPTAVGRPTQVALSGATALVDAFSAAQYPPRFYYTEIVLITAGPPDECGGSTDALAQSAADAAASGISTYVVQLGSDFDLNSVAKAGSKGPIYLVSAGDVVSDLNLILNDIISPHVPTSIPLPPPSPDPNHPIDPTQTVIIAYFSDNGTSVRGYLPRLNAASECSVSPYGGWYLDTSQTETRMTFCPCTVAAALTVSSTLYFCL